jgi:hypothetical protein
VRCNHVVATLVSTAEHALVLLRIIGGRRLAARGEFGNPADEHVHDVTGRPIREIVKTGLSV